MKEILLFCIPHAGGSAISYNQWKEKLDNGLKLFPVELAGRGIRSGEELYPDFNQAVEEVAGIIRREAGQKPYAIYGHSMGCWIAYEVFFRMAREDFPLPLHLFLSGNYPPYRKENLTDYHNLDEDDFVKMILKKGGTSDDVMDNLEMKNYYLPIIKNDFRIIEQYEKQKNDMKNKKINCPVTIISGKDDPEVGIKDLLLWKKCAAGLFHIIMIDGGHFFLFDNIGQTVSVVNETMRAYLGENSYV